MGFCLGLVVVVGLFWLSVWLLIGWYIRSGVTWWFFFALIAALLFAGFSVCVSDCTNTWFVPVFLVLVFGCGWWVFWLLV